MNTRCKQYKGFWLDPSSQAYKLLSEGKMKELDVHMKTVLTKEKLLTTNKGEASE